MFLSFNASYLNFLKERLGERHTQRASFGRFRDFSEKSIIFFFSRKKVIFSRKNCDFFRTFSVKTRVNPILSAKFSEKVRFSVFFRENRGFSATKNEGASRKSVPEERPEERPTQRASRDAFAKNANYLSSQEFDGTLSGTLF